MEIVCFNGVGAIRLLDDCFKQGTAAVFFWYIIFCLVFSLTVLIRASFGRVGESQRDMDGWLSLVEGFMYLSEINFTRYHHVSCPS